MYSRYDELLVRLRVEVSEPDVALLVDDPERMQHLRLFVRVRQTDAGRLGEANRADGLGGALPDVLNQ